MIGSELPRWATNQRAHHVTLVGIKYLRASQDASGRRISLGSQRDEGDEFFDECGIVDAGEFCDNDLSASMYATEVREGYEQALEALRSGQANLLWTFDPSRAQRDLEVYVKLRRICIEMGAFWAYGGRIYDMTDPADRKTTARDALEAEGASDTLSGHVRRGVRKRAKSGQHAGPLPYGYARRFDPATGESMGQVIDWAQAKVVRRIVSWCLDGKALSWIARQLNEAGVPCARDRRWDVRLVRGLAAERQHEHEWQRLLARLSPEDAAVAQALVLRVADGESPKALAQELNRDGVPYVMASRWNETKVRNIALSKPAAGIRVHQAKPVVVKTTDESGETVQAPVQAQWKAIIKPDERTELVARFASGDRKHVRDGSRVKYFWSGIARCGVCEAGVGPREKSANGPIYRCPDGHVYRSRVLLDAWLLDQAMSQLERSDAATLFRLEAARGNTAAAVDEARVLRAELEGWKADAISGRVSRSSFIDIEAGLLERIAKAEREAERAALPPVLATVIGPDARRAFVALDRTAQREILRAIMRPRIYHTSRRLKGRLDTGTIDPGWLFTDPAPADSGQQSAAA
ncbi:recombinase family protein [Amycolatopsis sp. NBC_00345]|uniref:recombinase family protein n=1 Tax=Amycolatopsis sp. NBC_00345 TaxID=2975955 RepID=UPI002E259609